MNNRLSLSGGYVLISRLPGVTVRAERNLNGHNRIDIAGTQFDREGAIGLRECLSCWIETGMFEALSDESAVPFPGKRMRAHKTYDGKVVTCAVQQLPGPSNNPCWYCVDEDGSWRLLQANPGLQPYSRCRVWRPFSGPIEAAHHIGRRFRYTGAGSVWKMVGVLQDSIIYHQDEAQHIVEGELSFELMARGGTWVDDDLPCGVVQKEEEKE